ncbi:pyridoxamine 5'-phosphate oxidase [Nocardioides sp.]|uniref:pyridoxamine 5'-phosphate oxidase n=1 Tax=Nocardioides sp. TaxID=35761 RepID=UPI0027368CF7|nr:pyridoxamine 5'-phosphate oxidase [Nocardioides sp.]MDP3892514.1 pyridoxamine 5'-phosphate oxidase [Nocardioides sp.]
MDDLAELREEYARGGLDETDLAADPLTMFGRWFAEARAAGLYEPNAMVVSTVSPEGRPTSRFVLLKVLDQRGFGFFTNLDSRKGIDLAANPACSVLFPWHPLERQVRVDGLAERLPRGEVEAYFDRRPRGSQVGAWASPQSAVVADRSQLDAAYAETERRFPEDVPVPDAWGGYVVVPETVEFWQGRPGRMHDRLRYRRAGDGWTVERLAP